MLLLVPLVVLRAEAECLGTLLGLVGLTLTGVLLWLETPAPLLPALRWLPGIGRRLP